MDPAVETVLSEYHARMEVEQRFRREFGPDEFERRRDEWLISIGAGAGQLLNVLIKEAKLKTILEVGASYGYSTVWLAEAARATGGKVISLEISPDKQAYARERLTRAGLVEFVDFRLGDALQTIPAVHDVIDFVLLDIWKELYTACFDLFYPKLRVGGFIAADNMILPPYFRDDALKYRRHVRSDPAIESILIPIGAGIELSRRTDGMETY